MMKRFLFAAALLSGAVPALAADVGVSVSIGQPGFYGRIDIGDYPEPRVIYREPVVIERVVPGRRPIYLNVPPGHAKNWRKHCGAYHACNERVYFVDNNWYDREYVPRYQERHHGRDDDYRRDDPDGGRGHGRGHGRDKDDDKGHGHGHGRGR